MTLPKMRNASCAECPWLRSSAPGWLGPHTAELWVRLAHSDEPIACHMTIAQGTDTGDWDDPKMRQCRGVAVYRRNVAKKPRDPQITVAPANRETVFAAPQQFIDHHERASA